MANPNEIPAPKEPQMAGCQQEPCSGFFIVNRYDRPSEEHIAERRADGKFYYIHPHLRDQKQFHGMTPSDPTPLEAFGLLVDVKAGIFVGALSNELPHTATYGDGRKRHWQGRGTFSFDIQNETSAGTDASEKTL